MNGVTRQASGATSAHSREKLWFSAFLILLAAIRIAAARGDLWFDEIWSLSFARELDAPWETLTRIHHDNNHPLNTLALYLTLKAAGAHAWPIAYRLLPLVAGIAIVPLVFWMERRCSDRPSPSGSWLAALFGGMSFLAVVYSSEARGYAPAAFFGVAAFAIVRCGDVEVTRNRRLAFALACALGVLSHLTFVFVYAGLAAWTLARAAHGGQVRWRGWIALHMLPVALLVGDYVVDVRRLAYGGGPPFQVGDVVGRTLSLAVNGPDGGAVRYVAAIVTVAVLVRGVAVLWARNNDEWIFFATTLIAAPASVLLVYHARYLDPRYFFVVMPFFWLLAARTLATLWADRARGRLIAAALGALFVAGGVVRLTPFLRYQRGGYAAAVDALAQLTQQRPITVGSDHDVRNRMVLEYYGEVLPAGQPLVYVPLDAWNRRVPEWFMVHSFEPAAGDNRPPASISVGDGAEYRLLRTFPYGGISGWTWYLYHRADRAMNTRATSAPPTR
jgi:hypothetical protein